LTDDAEAVAHPLHGSTSDEDRAFERIGQASEAGVLAAKADPGQQVYIVPAFTGLGAPYWDPAASGAIFGLTRNSGPAEFARAVIES
ncbi:FGGY-family carbohydrate kinase, partial [Rhizobium ruizarguesonis]